MHAGACVHAAVHQSRPFRSTPDPTLDIRTSLMSYIVLFLNLGDVYRELRQIGPPLLCHLCSRLQELIKHCDEILTEAPGDITRWVATVILQYILPKYESI